MQVSDVAVSFNVDDVQASSHFLQAHFGFREAMAAEGFVSLRHPDIGLNVIFLGIGIEQLPEGFRDVRAGGVILALTVSDIESEARRIAEAGLALSMPLKEEPWGEKLFQVQDPNGIIIQVVQWVEGAAY